NSSQSSFTPYKISVAGYEKIETIQALLKAVFANTFEQNTNEHIEEINETFLLHLAYGIQHAEGYNPDITPSEIMSLAQELIQEFPERASACQYFLTQYQIVSQLHGPTKIELNLHRDNDWLTPRTLENPNSFCLSETSSLKKDKQIEAMVNDIQLLHINNFM